MIKRVVTLVGYTYELGEAATPSIDGPLISEIQPLPKDPESPPAVRIILDNGEIIEIYSIIEVWFAPDAPASTGSVDKI